MFLGNAWLVSSSDTVAVYQYPDGSTTRLTGTGFAFNDSGQPTSGAIAQVEMYGPDSQPWASIVDLNYFLPDLHSAWFHLNGDIRAAHLVLLSGQDWVNGGVGNDNLDGGDG